MCCTAGWPIPIEHRRAALIEKGDWLVDGDVAPEYAGVLARDARGACVFYDGRCRVHANRPMSCVHFPYLCLIDARGVHVTLSHYCPTAASLLFERSGEIAIVEGPSPVPGLALPEGLDARESLPPLREGSSRHPQLMSFEEFSEWERRELRTLGGLARATSTEFAPVIERYLAARLFASWAAYQSDGTTAVRRSVHHARAVLHAAIDRACRLAARPLDERLLCEGIRAADLLLVHGADSNQALTSV